MAVIPLVDPSREPLSESRRQWFRQTESRKTRAGVLPADADAGISQFRGHYPNEAGNWQGELRITFASVVSRLDTRNNSRYRPATRLRHVTRSGCRTTEKSTWGRTGATRCGMDAGRNRKAHAPGFFNVTPVWWRGRDASHNTESHCRRLVALTGVVLPVTIVGAILVFVIPVPAVVLDLLISANVTLAVLVLLTTLAIRAPHDFSSFPTVLLTTTLTRLVLNVATTRRVLTHGGTDRLDAAGEVIRAFGEFVAGDQVLVGVILFSILVVIQFVVITKGATRISEVAARFMLDGLPGRQMAIDADLHAGLIDQHEAHRRRELVYRQADFFGAMDGAGKFVRGDAVAGVIILVINISAGLYLGVVNHGMSLGDAINVYTKLTIGDGLVSQVPAFLISLAAGLIVTRSSTETDLGRDVVEQLLGRPECVGDRGMFPHAAGVHEVAKTSAPHAGRGARDRSGPAAEPCE